eukprot:TRINITY_DN21943_c0_g1_i1.p1 TRINITY_DN21943_c0_g1~~TRINITY_DN21943_c0_g1_i1.p1  ORF type:complete len:137 (+),score=47.84 TRINITY_DN21943_c0_g1_i1:43-453(+)
MSGVDGPVGVQGKNWGRMAKHRENKRKIDEQKLKLKEDRETNRKRSIEYLYTDMPLKPPPSAASQAVKRNLLAKQQEAEKKDEKKGKDKKNKEKVKTSKTGKKKEKKDKKDKKKSKKKKKKSSTSSDSSSSSSASS